MIIAIAAPSGQFADRVKKPWIVLPYMIPSVPPDERRGHVLADGRDEDQEERRQDSGQAQRDGDAPEARPRSRSEVGGRLQLVAIDTLHRRVDRQRGERDPDIDEGHDHRRAAVEQELERLIGEAEPR